MISGTTRYRSFTPIAGPYKGACCPEGSSCTRLDDKKWTCKLPVSRMASEWRRAGRRCRCLSRAHMLQACGAALPRLQRLPALALTPLPCCCAQRPAALQCPRCPSIMPVAGRTCAGPTAAAPAAPAAPPACACPSGTGSARATAELAGSSSSSSSSSGSDGSAAYRCSGQPGKERDGCCICKAEHGAL